MNKKVIIGVVIVIIVAILAAIFLLNPSEVTLVAGDTSVTLPSDYELDQDTGIATKGDIGVLYMPVASSDVKAQKALFDTLKSNGKDAGYKKVKTDTINGFKVYQYSANPDKLKKVSSDKVREGNYETWKEYEPYTPFKDMTKMDVKQFRYTAYVNETSKTISELYIFTNNTDVDLYSSDIESIINSIAVVEK